MIEPPQLVGANGGGQRLGDRVLQLFTNRSFSEVQCERQQQCRLGQFGVASGDELVRGEFFPVQEVIQNLEADADVPTERRNHRLVSLHRASHPQARVQRRFKRGRGLQRVELHRVERRQFERVGTRPTQFGSLAFAQFEMCIGETIQNIRRRLGSHLFATLTDEPVAQPDQIVTHIDRRADSIATVQRLLSVAVRVVVLNVIVDKRRLVKGFHRHRRATDFERELGQRIASGSTQTRAAGQRVISGERDERTQSLAPFHQPVPRDRLGLSQQRVRCGTANAHGRQHFVELLFKHFVRRAHQRDIARGALFFERHVLVETVPDPRFIELRVLAVARVKRHRIGRHARKQHFVDRLLQHVEARHTENAVHMSRHDDLEHDRRAFRHEDFVTELLGLHFVVGDRTRSALLAVEAKFVVVGGAAIGVLEAVR